RPPALAAGYARQRRRRRGAVRARLRRRALDELLADQRLRADRALGVAAEVLEAGPVDAQDDGGLLVRGHIERVHLADLDPGDLDILARDDRERVLEDRAHLVGAARVRRRAGRARGGSA